MSTSIKQAMNFPEKKVCSQVKKIALYTMNIYEKNDWGFFHIQVVS